ncbi:PiggyBac transposable element-derived protein [Cinara cedri]|uniref:PiggyBac transposable element-derived protein n=1 Tax=Cinara cedri TaxID=506608 RepID=A0A5E4M7H8_9HEMI|nr:PiggyBac transposable element-derived protein [Cinara cedri]
MDHPAVPSRVDRSRSPRKKSIKTNTLTDAELLDILDNDKWMSSDEEFDDDFDECITDSDGNDGENEGDDTQYIDIGEFVGSGENEVSEVLSEIYSSTNFNWSTDSPTNTEYFEFIPTPVLKCLPNGDNPIDYFNLLVTDKLLDILVEETNNYAIEIFLNTVTDNSRISDWVDTNRLEMKTFLSLLFHMGTIKMPRLEDYWKTNKLFNLPFFRAHMSRNRFTLLLRALHFSRNPTEGESVPRNRLHKIQPIINYFNSRMNEVFEPTKNLSLDESMVLWRGRLIFRQYIKNKKHKFDVKMYMLTESWGFIHRIMVYSGQGHDVSESMTHTEFVVDNLMNGLYHKGRSLYMDNFYNSVKLSRKLLQKRTYITGTLRSNRKNNPIEVTNKKLKK